LGTGTSQGVPVIGCKCEVCRSTDPKDKRLRTAAMFSVKDVNLVVDSGPDFRQQMLRERVDHVEALLITHEHNDHVIGLDDVRPFNFLYRRDMPVYSIPRVTKELQMRFPYIFAENKYPGAPMVKLFDIDPTQPFEIEGIHIQPIQVWHGKMSVIGYQIDDITYLTDVKTMDPEEIEKVKNTPHLVLNALHHQAHYSHLNLREALELIEIINPGKAYLTHISHHMGLHATISKELPSNVFMGYDGMVIGG
jgi:phosphoribosyl 1,2-cyclic phosphate phosphodiesterase